MKLLTNLLKQTTKSKTFKKDFPTKAVWKAYLDDMKAKPALHPYDKFLKSKEPDKNLFNELEKEPSITSVAQFSNNGQNVDTNSDEQQAEQTGEEAANQDTEQTGEEAANQDTEQTGEGAANQDTEQGGEKTAASSMDELN